VGGKNKREHLIKIGQEVIWSKGYDLCSVKDITQSAGLPKGSFYHYFESKEKFALEAMTDFINSFKEKIPNNEKTIESLEHLIDLRIKSIVKINYARECYMSVMCHAYSEQEESFRLEVLDAIEKSNEAMLVLLTDLKKQQLINTDLSLDELVEFIDFSWRGARLKARLLKSDMPLQVFKKYLLELILR
jgi:TetR/AcrR family transcriptional repressor of nem operon